MQKIQNQMFKFGVCLVTFLANCFVFDLDEIIFWSFLSKLNKFNYANGFLVNLRYLVSILGQLIHKVFNFFIKVTYIIATYLTTQLTNVLAELPTS